jgi:3-oxoacyl-[acyl-carrier protein] reductase
MAERVTLVTGMSRGIGRAIADTLRERNHTVIGLDRVAPEKPFEGPFFTVDLADQAATDTALEEITNSFAVDNLVNNAGMAIMDNLGDLKPADLAATVDVNVRAAVMCAQAVLPGMRQKQRGRIVNLGSRAALGKTGRSFYAASKAALIGLTRTWALETARDGITVNCIAPGPIDTELFQGHNPPGSETRNAIEASIPVRRIGRPGEVAAACAYFLSDDAGFTTGQVLYVCGGMTVGLAPV